MSDAPGEKQEQPGGIRQGVMQSVQARLLIMLVMLSLPLLIVSLLQLNKHRQNLAEQGRIIVRLTTAAAASTLEIWLDDHRDKLAEESFSLAEIASLYATLQQQLPAEAEATVIVLDPRGQPLFGEVRLPVPRSTAQGASKQTWSDGVQRVTSVRRIEPYGWSVVVGVPEYTRSVWTVLWLMATWAAALIATTLLAIWAVGRFTTPLSRLAQAASTFGEGHLHERIEIETKDELGTLARSFNAMAASLQERFEELQNQRAFIAEVLNSLPLGVAVLDDELTIRTANPTFARFVGKSADDLAGHKLFEVAQAFFGLQHAVEDVRRVRRPFVNYSLQLDLDQSGEKQAFWDIILWPMRAHGTGRADLLLILSAVSDRVRAERLAQSAFAAERARAAELESVINQMDEGVIIVDGQGAYRVNPKAARTLGLNQREHGHNVWRLLNTLHLFTLDGQRLAPIATPLGRALENGERVSDERLIFLTFGHEERVLNVSATPLIGERGRREGAVAVFRDVTDEVRRHEQLTEAYERLREHDRLKSAFVANVSHELRTPLNVIIGLCRLLQRDAQTPLTPPQRETVERMDRNARALLTLVNTLIDYSQLEAGRASLRLEEVEAADLVASLAEGFAEEARNKGLEFIVEIAHDLGTVTTDRDKLTQVIFNLLSNAIKFTSSGVITLKAETRDEGSWLVEVADTGIGIPEEVMPVIFEEFRQADDRLTRAHGGVGLGLAITRKVVQLLGGEIQVESRVGQGSRFRVLLPRVVRQRTGTGSLVDGPAFAYDLRRSER
ncbi:MAG: hypothetical protein C4334_05245 [Pyrinomonas sp.]|uniref:ATP-binding protein n=1 Tax=Pyrinomonas sp. TaxID=2080306 RepID=UPI00332CED8D